MLFAVQVAIVFIFFGVTGFFIVSLLPASREEFSSGVDRILFSLVCGMGFYIILFILLNALFHVRIQASSLFAVFIISSLAALSTIRTRRIDLRISFRRQDVLILVALLVLVFLALKVRLINTLYYPDHLVDADPYRHLIRSKALLQSGMLSQWEPLIIGDIPILFMQGCYVFVAIVSLVSGIDLWFVWKYGTIVVGVLGILSFYLMIKYIFHKNTVLALASAGFLSLSPIHIFRTDIGFSEPYALVFFPLTMLFMIMFVRERRYEYGLLFGLFFSLTAANNLLAGALAAPLVLVFGLYAMIRKRDRRTATGFGLAFLVFLLFLLLWSQTYLGVSLFGGGSALSAETVELVEQERSGIAFIPLIMKWLGVGTIVLAFMGLLYTLLESRLKGRIDEGAANIWANGKETKIFFLIFFFLYFILAYAANIGFIVIPAARVYRYLTLPAYCFSLFAGITCVTAVERVSTCFPRLKRSVRIAGYSLAAAALCMSIYLSRPKIFWLMGPTEEEFTACEWVNENLPGDAIFVAHWYTGDFVRSLTERAIIISPRHRTQVDLEMKTEKTHVPLLKNRDEMVHFSKERRENVYLFQSRYGPWAQVAGDPRFEKIYTSESDSEKSVSIFLIEKNTDD